MAVQVATAAGTSTAERILDVAERLGQTRGFNGFSYADIAAEVGVTKASLHYHFPTKAALALALIERYTERFGVVLDAIAARDESAAWKLRQYVDLYESVLVLDRLCLCGMFAAEILTLPAPVQNAVRAFFDLSEQWLVTLLAEGRQTESLRYRGEERDAARYVIGVLEGAMLLAYSFDDVARFRDSADRLLSELDMAVLAAP